MIRITKTTDYGIVLMTQMASRPGDRFSAPDLAEEAQLPLPMVSKILKTLTREGLLDSHRGVNGGYALARPPREIAVSEIIAALEGPIAITECVDDSPGVCSQEAVCPVRSNWQLINGAIRRALDGICLADMARPLPRDGAGERLVTLGRRELAEAGA
ncbi:MAG TPA: SUF system Fe-S cluster assembly regulator [Thermoanaerobaculia bacterium]|nr:SUF system Fe-S cluster assembly regulator [Thermoanaerobaculia bacterium]